MKLTKKQLFKIHGWVGVKLGILFFIVCLSGTIATVSSELDWLFNPAVRATPATQLASRNTIVANFYAAYPQSEITFWLAAREPYLCDVLYAEDAAGDRTYVFANPYTGDIQGSTNLTIQRYFRDLHYYLFIPFQIGHFTVLAIGFLLLFALLTALLFYKKWYRKFTDLKRGRGKLTLWRSLHRLGGLWSLPFVLLFSITGIWYFLERTDTANITTIANPKTPMLTTGIPDSVTFAGLVRRLDYDRAADSARAHIAGLRVKEIYVPRKPTDPLYLTGVSDAPLVRNRANRVYLHPLTYEVLGVQRADDLPVRTWLNDIADPLHFGNFGGLWTKLLWFLAGAVITGLVFTGLYISRRRRAKTAAQLRARSLGGWKYVNGLVMAALLGFMYYHLVVRYRVGWDILVLVSGGWLLVMWLGWSVLRRADDARN